MMSTGHPRLRAPAVMIVGGVAAAAAVVVGYGWGSAVPVVIITIVAGIGYCLWGGRDSDTGAMIGSRADERQPLVRMQPRSLACGVMLITAAAGTLVAAALKDRIWPFALVGVGVVVSFLGGLAFYGSREVR